jgi:hypothetical protein
MKQANRKQTYLRGAAWAITVLAYGYLGYRLYIYDGWTELGNHLSKADTAAWLCGLLALLLMPVNMLLEAWRWQFLMGDLSLREAQRQVYFSKMAGQLTPYQLGEYPARGLLMEHARWAELLSKGVVGSMTMTLAITLVGILPLAVWLSDGRWRPEWMTVVGLMLAVVALTAALPWLLRRWIRVDSRLLMGSLGQSVVRYACWCVQLALVLRLFGMPFSTEWLVLIPVYYLIITIAPSIAAAEAGVRGAAAIWLFGTAEATLAGILLWAINSLLPMLIGTFVNKNAK